MRSKFENLSRPEIDFLIDNCNFSKEEESIIKMANIGIGEVQIADKLNVSVSSVAKKKAIIAIKIVGFLEAIDNLTTIYVNGKRVDKEDLRKIEIDIESVKQMIANKLTKRQEKEYNRG